MNRVLLLICITLSILANFNSPFVDISSVEANPASTVDNDFSEDLKSKINNLMSKSLNESSNVLNSSVFTNTANLTSNQVIISNNKITSTVGSNDSSSSSIIKDQVKTINGVCSSTKVGGNGNDTLASSGKCNDQLTGGLGADKFTCGEGSDTIRDYNPEEGDVILDRQNCEKIL